MFTNNVQQTRRNHLQARRWLLAIAFAALSAMTVTPAYTQGGFVSGSTGADGPFAPTANMTITVSDTGVYNYTSVNIPANVTITYRRNPCINNPVVILATQNVTIGGRIVLEVFDGGANLGANFGGKGGPGGFNGGMGGTAFDNRNGITGDGPGGGGGGQTSTDLTNCGSGGGGGYLLQGQDGIGAVGVAGTSGLRYGGKTLLPLIGGSGGGGGGACKDGIGGGGGGGGGAILIAGSGTISFTGETLNNVIQASGGGGGRPILTGNFGGGGSGGGIRLIANTITGSPTLDVSGGAVGALNNLSGASPGYVSIEAFDRTGFAPRLLGTTLSFARPGLVMPTNLPMLRIVSVGGVNAPDKPNGSFGTDVSDVVLPAAQTNPVPVSIQASNIPTGSIVRVTVIQDSGTRTEVNSTPLAGTSANSTATANVTLPNGVSVVTAAISLNVQLALGRPLFIDGERVDRLEAAAGYGWQSELVFITQSGRRVRSSEL